MVHNKLIILFLVIVIGRSESQVRKGKDSYLEALKESHSPKNNPTRNANDRDSKYSPFDNQPPPSHYGPPQGYPDPHPPNYGPPSQQYGPPFSMYGPPAHIPRYL